MSRRSLATWALAALLCAAPTALHAQAAKARTGGPPAAALARARAAAARDLSQLLVREVPAPVVQAEAARLVGELRADQVAALAAGSSLLDVMSMEAPGGADGVTAAPARAVRLVTGAALGDAEGDLLFVPVPPCRVIDTRLGGGPLAASEIRDFQVAGTANFAAQGGNATGCGIPLGATTPLAPSVVFNFIAVNPQGAGHLTAWEFGQTAPNASIINYAKVGLNIANGVVVPISGVGTTPRDLHVIAGVSSTHVVADVTGYFTRFPIEQFQGSLKSELLESVNNVIVDLSNGACAQLNSCTVSTPAAGTVIVEVWGHAVVHHVAGTDDRLEVAVETAPVVACNQTGANTAIYEVSAALGTSMDVDFGFSLARAFPQAAGATSTYRLSGQMVSGAGVGGAPPDQAEFSRMICTFIPD